MRSKSHPAESRQITYSLFTLTSCFQKILNKWKRQVKSEKVISKKSSFLRMRIFWRREWDSNPRDVAVKRFSRPPRYDRFDIPAYSVLPRGFFRAVGFGKRRRGTPDPALSQLKVYHRFRVLSRIFCPPACCRRCGGFRFPIERMGDFREACAGQRGRVFRAGSRARRAARFSYLSPGAPP